MTMSVTETTNTGRGRRPGKASIKSKSTSILAADALTRVAIKARTLTAQQETFCMNVAKGKTLADSYRAGYSPKNNSKTVYAAAGRLIKTERVARRIAELRALQIKKVEITLEEHINKLGQLSDQAAAKDQYSAAINGEMLRGKVSGLYVDKVETKNINLNGSLASEIKLSRLTDDELTEYIRLTAKASDDSMDDLKVVTDA
jgi:hypothetical protein